MQIEHDPTYDAVIRIAHLGDCMGMLVRGDNIVWRSDEMWWGVSFPLSFSSLSHRPLFQYNHPLQLGPPSSSSTQLTLTLPVQPHTFTLPVLADDILILASDGLSDNLWDEDVLDEVLKFRRQGGWALSRAEKEEQDVVQALAGLDISGSCTSNPLLKRKAFAGMLSEALCSRAKRVSETRAANPNLNSNSHSPNATPRKPIAKKPRFSIIPEEAEPAREGISLVTSSSSSSTFASLVNAATSKSTPEHKEYPNTDALDAGEIPFARRAKLNGRRFRGGKVDGGCSIVSFARLSSFSLVPFKKKKRVLTAFI